MTCTFRDVRGERLIEEDKTNKMAGTQSQSHFKRILGNPWNSAPHSNRSAIQQQKSSKCGWLKKQGGVVKSWHRRWFTIKGDQIYYYTNDDENKLLGTIFLPGNKVVEYPLNPQEPDKFVFDISPGQYSS